MTLQTMSKTKRITRIPPGQRIQGEDWVEVEAKVAGTALGVALDVEAVARVVGVIHVSRQTRPMPGIEQYGLLGTGSIAGGKSEILWYEKEY